MPCTRAVSSCQTRSRASSRWPRGCPGRVRTAGVWSAGEATEPMSPSMPGQAVRGARAVLAAGHAPRRASRHMLAPQAIGGAPVDAACATRPGVQEPCRRRKKGECVGEARCEWVVKSWPRPPQSRLAIPCGRRQRHSGRSVRGVAMLCICHWCTEASPVSLSATKPPTALGGLADLVQRAVDGPVGVVVPVALELDEEDVAKWRVEAGAAVDARQVQPEGLEAA